MMFAFPLIAQTEGDVFGEESGKTGPHTQILPNWSIKKEVSTIEKSLESYDPLIQSLEEANNDLKMDLAEYLKKPGDQVLAGKITAKMSKYAKKIVANVDTITENQDVLLQVFTDLNQKLQQFDGYLNFKATELKVEVEKYELKEKELKKQLKDLALKIKDTQDPNLQEQYKKEFRQMYTKYNLYVRYKDGFTRNYQDYETLAKNLQALVKMFGMLNDAFSTLLGNLESEKKYLIDNIRLQADAIRVQKLVHEGISDGSKAVVKVSQKLALLYTQVEGFAKVHEKINRDMAKFTDSTKILSSLVEQIEKSPYQSAPTIDKAIDYFADLKE
jgi:chromosome segregation ATPase